MDGNGPFASVTIQRLRWQLACLAAVVPRLSHQAGLLSRQHAPFVGCEPCGIVPTLETVVDVFATGIDADGNVKKLDIKAARRRWKALPIMSPAQFSLHPQTVAPLPI
ncbi:hypothetical protein BDZ90DRAFT_46738 [Jaminaea rosea]|uniref:Uncharacterized protein n=1 Tax=Jaminaea rosea TaxID=1569628 RepID=A0A316ULK2_9BASI|nr:hypothetical protein BDZ90DRAFT_46738 [Jaminaea rosea]PWN26172.1 hypothetical protein BDZ90DRAFT_46738 [Jaminaea rosea]